LSVLSERRLSFDFEFESELSPLIDTQENALLREALDREKWKRDSKLETSFRDVEQQYSSEVVTLRQKVSLLMETNNMLRNENDKWLNRVQEQETIVMQLREQVGHDVDGKFLPILTFHLGSEPTCLLCPHFHSAFAPVHFAAVVTVLAVD
jgi:hypothetical protein